MPDDQAARPDEYGATRSGTKSGRTGRYIVIVAAVIAVAVAAMRRSPSSTPAVEPPREAASGRLLSVRTMSLAAVGTLEKRHTFTGVIEAARRSQLGFELSGRVLELLVDEGDGVEAGQPLARLDTRSLQARLRQLEAQRRQEAAVLAELRAGPREETIAAARAAVEQHEAELELWTLTCSRNERLRSGNAITEQQYDDARLNMAAARARLSAARHQLRELETGTRPEQIEAQNAAVEQLDAQLAFVKTDLEKSTLRAPFAGTIARRLIDEGTVASATTAIMELVDTRHLEAHIGLPAEMASRLQSGMELTLRLGEREVPGRLRAVRPMLDPVTRTQVVIIDVADDAVGQAVPGQVVRLDIHESGETDGFWVPLSAVTQGQRGLWSLYAAQPVLADRSQAAESVAETGSDAATDSDAGTVTGAETATDDPAGKVAVVERRTVEVVYSDEQRALVRGTVYTGDRIIVDGLHRVVPGQRVRVVDGTVDRSLTRVSRTR